jgi:hypothetical protein
LLDQIGWYYGMPPLTDSLTGDIEWWRTFLYDQLEDAARNLDGSEAEHFRSRLAIVNVWKELLDQIGWTADEENAVV